MHRARFFKVNVRSIDRLVAWSVGRSVISASRELNDALRDIPESESNSGCSAKSRVPPDRFPTSSSFPKAEAPQMWVTSLVARTVMERINPVIVVPATALHPRPPYGVVDRGGCFFCGCRLIFTFCRIFEAANYRRAAAYARAAPILLTGLYIACLGDKVTAAAMARASRPRPEKNAAGRVSETQDAANLDRPWRGLGVRRDCDACYVCQPRYRSMSVTHKPNVLRDVSMSLSLSLCQREPKTFLAGIRKIDNASGSGDGRKSKENEVR